MTPPVLGHISRTIAGVAPAVIVSATIVAANWELLP